MLHSEKNERQTRSAHLKRRARDIARLLAMLAAAISLGNATARELSVVPPGGMQSGSTDGVYSTIADAMAAIQPGDHLVIESGVYREAILFPSRDWGRAKETVIEGAGSVTINGADIVKGWVPISKGLFAVSFTQEPEQVVVDAAPLQQIGGTVFDGYPLNASSAWNPLKSEMEGGIWPGRIDGDQHGMPINSFYFDHSARRLYVRFNAPDLVHHSVEVSVRTHSVYGESLAHVTLRNMRFRLGNTSLWSRDGLVTLKGKHIALDRITVTEADSVGVELDGDDNTMMHVTANYCGQLGIKARGKRVQILSSETSYNNSRGFNKWWEAGGAKFVGDEGLQNSVVSAHRAFGNRGDGIWFDWENRSNRVEYSASEYNSGMGIQYEASVSAVIVDNVVIGNGQRGIYLPHSSLSVVAYNLVAGNGLQGIAIIDEGRMDPEGKFDLRPKGNRVFANVIAWNQAALTMPGNRANNTADGNVYIGAEEAGNFQLGWRSPTFDTLSAWSGTTRQDIHSVFIERAPDAAFERTVAKKQDGPDLLWYRALRPTLAPLGQDVDAAALTSDMKQRDGRPGPAL